MGVTPRSKLGRETVPLSGREKGVSLDQGGGTYLAKTGGSKSLERVS